MERKKTPKDYLMLPEREEMIAFTVRIPLDLRLKIKKGAEDNMTSINHFVEAGLYCWLDLFYK